MAQPKIDAMHLFDVMKFRDTNPMATNEAITAYAKKQFPRDEFISSAKFIGWLDNGRGSYLEREMHKNLTGMVALDRLASETRQALLDRDEAIMERDNFRDERDEYLKVATDAKLQLALMTAPPEPVAV